MPTDSLRKIMRARRRALPVQQQKQAALDLSTRLETLREVKTSQRIGLYLANDGEIDPAPFMRWAWRQQKSCYLPVLDEQDAQPMRFAKVVSGSTFKPNRFNIPEPVDSEILSANKLDIILMPLVAFDNQGNRIGMGGGYYDRTLAFKGRQPYHQRPALIGLAHAFQRAEKIDPAPWDIPLDGVVSEEQAILFGQQST